MVDDIFCLFQGHIQNITSLKQQYGLGKTANEVIIVIEAYKTLRDRGPFPASQVLRDLNGKFAFILFDSSSNTTFMASVSIQINYPLLLSISLFFKNENYIAHTVPLDNNTIFLLGA